MAKFRTVFLVSLPVGFAANFLFKNFIWDWIINLPLAISNTSIYPPFDGLFKVVAFIFAFCTPVFYAIAYYYFAKSAIMEAIR